MWVMSVVFLAPVLDEMLGLSQRVEEITIQAFAFECADETLDEGVLPGMAGFDVERLGFQLRLSCCLPGGMN